MNTLDTAIQDTWARFGLRHLSSMTEEEWREHDRRIAEQRQIEERAAMRDKLERRREALLAAGCPAAIVQAIPAVDREASAIRELASFSQDDHRIRVLAGGVGTGKTTAAVLWLAMHGGLRPRFLTAMDLLRPGLYDRKATEAWKQATSVVLDDLGTEYMDGNGAASVIMDEFVNHFANGHARLVITTNLPLRALSERYGARVHSRILGSGRWQPVIGPDRRRHG